MSRTAIPIILKESLMDGEYIRRLYRRANNNKSWIPIGWVILESDGTPLYTVTDSQLFDMDNLYDLFFTQTKNEGDES